MIKKELIQALYDAMSADLCVMSEYGDDDAALLEELETATPEDLEYYKGVFLNVC